MSLLFAAPVNPSTDIDEVAYLNDVAHLSRGSPTSTTASSLSNFLPQEYYTPPSSPKLGSASDDEPYVHPYPFALIRRSADPRPHGTTSSSTSLNDFKFSPHYLGPRLDSINFSPSDALPWESSQHSPKNAATNATIESSMLTPEIMAIAEDALAKYEEIRLRYPSKSPDDLEEPHLEELHQLPQPQVQQHPFTLLTAEKLEDYFAAAIDAKNAIQLRKSAVGVDITHALQTLLLKMTIYEKDEAVLQTALDEIRLIKEECWHRNLGLNFYALEFLRRIYSRHSLSVTEKHPILFNETPAILQEKDDAQQVAQQFFIDPFSLKERRLPNFLASRR